MKRQHNSTRTLPRNTMFLAALATLSFLEPGGPKRDLLGLSATAPWGHMLAPKGRQGYTPSSLAIPAFNLSPKPGPYGGGRPGDHLLRGLGADMGGRVCEPEETVCGVPALKVLSFVFLGQRNPLQPLPAWPCSTHKRPVGAPPVVLFR